MSKRVVIILVEAITVFLFLIALNLFYNSKMANLAVSDYQFQLDKMGQLLSKSLEAVKKTKVQNGQLIYELDELKKSADFLSTQNNDLRRQNVNFAAEIKGLKQELDKFKVNSEVVVPLKEKIKSIVSLVDRLDPDSQGKGDLDRLLRAIYEQLNSVDFSMAKLAKDEPLYREMIKEKELELQQEVNKAREASAASQRLSTEIEKRDAQIKAFQAEVDALADYKQTSLEAVQEVESLTKARDSLKQDLETARKEITKLNEKIKPIDKIKDNFAREKNKWEKTAAEMENDLTARDKQIGTLQDKLNKLEADYKEADSRYAELEKTVKGYQESLAGRAARIVSLEESLEGKQISFEEANFKLKKQLRELAQIRNDMVKIKLDNARLKESLEEKERAFDILKENMSKMQSVNQEFRDSVDKASRVFGSKMVSDQRNQTLTPSHSEKNKEKEVKVEIDSVASGMDEFDNSLPGEKVGTNE